MKKYLMTGIAALALCAGFTSCSHDLDSYSPEEIQQLEAQKIVEKYNKAFEATFGKPAADQTWGFGPTAAARTREGEYANGNMWAAKDDGRYLVPDPLTDGQKARVQFYYQTNHITNPVQTKYGNIDFFMQQVYTGGTDPITNYTDYQGTNPAYSPEKYQSVADQANKTAPTLEGGIKMNHLTAGPNDTHINNFNGGSCGWYENVLNNDPQVLNDYPNPTEGGYLANQNKDYNHRDQIELMLNTNTDCFGFANADDSDVRRDLYHMVSAADIDAYITANKTAYDAWLAAKNKKNSTNIVDAIVNDFWGQLGRGFIGFDYDMLITGDVFCQPNPYDTNFNIYLRTGEAEKGNQYKKAYKGGKLIDYDDFNTNYQFNSKDVVYVRNETNFYCGTFEHLTLNDLYVKYDENGNIKTTNDGTINYAINLDKIDQMLRDGYLPVQGKKLEEWVMIGGCNDGYFSDWIVTFMPGLHYSNEVPPTPTTLSIRVMAEDLSVSDPSHDFDFNDVVFDVERVNDNEAKITLQAAGGTLPLRINCDEDGNGGWEVHAAFEVETNIMVNTNWTGSNSASHKPVVLGTITITNGFTEANFYTTVKNIPVRVQKTVNNEKVWMLLQAPKGKAPSKFGCPVGTDWVDERVFIDKIYEFTEWVTGANYTLNLREKTNTNN